jgi:putative oxidoreductase
MYFLNYTYKYKDFGLLFLRIGIGLMFVLHGLPKIAGGEEVWQKLGEAMQVFGIYEYQVVWGYMAAFVECGGGVLLFFGLLHRVTCVLLFITMLVAFASHIFNGDGFGLSSHSIELAILFFSLIFIGPGKFSIDRVLFSQE